jgi:hypothetical protein
MVGLAVAGVEQTHGLETASGRTCRAVGRRDGIIGIIAGSALGGRGADLCDYRDAARGRQLPCSSGNG